VKRNLIISLAGLGLALFAWSGSAQAEGDVSFGIRPTKAYVDNPELSGYFIHSLTPGAVLADEALVMNSGDVPVNLKLYATAGVTAINGGTAFANESEEGNGVASWLSPSLSEIALEPGEERVVPFTINVPADASPGEHVAGLVVEAVSGGEAPASSGDNTQFAVTVVRRAGVAVVIDVPGPHVAGLEITGIRLMGQDDNQGATFAVSVRNTGNVFVRGEGSLVIKDQKGTELASIPIKMDTVLAGDSTYFQVTHPVRLADGSYLLSAILEYDDGKTAVLEGAEVTVKNGQPESPEESESPQAGLAPAITTLTSTEEEGGFPIGRYVACGAALLALVVTGVAVILWRRTRARRPYQ
jgi:hypothetical protein